MSLIELTAGCTVDFFYQEDVISGSGKRLKDQMCQTTLCNLAGGIYGASVVYVVEITDCNKAFDLQKLQKVISISNTTINKNDKIFFGDSSFPSLLLGRLNLDVKRTTKPDIADRIILDRDIPGSNIFHRLFLFDEANNIGVCADPLWREDKVSYGIRINKIISTLKSYFNYNMKLYCSVKADNYKLYEIYQKFPNKFTSTIELSKYVHNQLPMIKEDEYSGISDMLKSQDKATVSLGLGMLQYYNFFDFGINIVSDLTTGLCLDLPSNRESEYIYFLLGTNRSLLYDSRHYGITRKINFLMDCLNKFAVTPSMSVKEKVYTTLRGELFNDISEKYHSEFERLNVTLSLTPNDEIGETDASSSEVEGEEV